MQILYNVKCKYLRTGCGEIYKMALIACQEKTET